MLALLLILGGALAAAQEDHSRHQHAVAGLGTVNFPTSCNASAQKLISRGAALLHSFGYEEARLAFNEAAKADPACAMAHWGVARTWYHPIWAPPSPDELKQGAAALERALANGAKTERERDYIHALAVFYKDWQTVDHATRAKAYEQALAKVRERHPNDDEAAIFHALQLVAIGYLDPTDKTYAWQKKGGEILNQVLPRHQNHPGVAHYIIHSVDYPSIAELGLKAARAYAKIAPDSPHALHMPSHIFTRLGLWDDSIASNTASAKSASRRHNGCAAAGARSTSFTPSITWSMPISSRRRTKALKRCWRRWRPSPSSTRTSSPRPTLLPPRRRAGRSSGTIGKPLPRWRSSRRGSRGIGSETRKRWCITRKRSERPVRATRRLRGARPKKSRAIRKALPATRDYDWTGSIGAQWEAATALIAFAEGKKDEGLRLLRTAADHEDAVDKHPVTPGALLPVREILADLLLENGAAPEALNEYEAVLKIAPRRFNATAGAAKAADKAGDKTKARAYAMQLLEIAKNAEASRPELAWARGYVGKK